MALFPPIVASSMPAFAIGQNTNNSVRIYYTLSNYNSTQRESIQAIHVSVRRQSSNVNVLVNDNQIIEKPVFLQDEEDKLLNRYYITINSNDLKDGFQKDILYKVQLRFSSLTIQASGMSEASFFTDNIQLFSEWSEVCIIKPIIAPIFYIDNFHYDKQDDYGQQQSAQDTFSYNLAEFIGVYKPEESYQSLKAWRLRLLSGDFTLDQKQNIKDYTIEDSGWQNTSAYNYTLDSTAMTFECSLKYDFNRKKSNSDEYKLYFEIETKNGYLDSKIYSFEFQQINVNAIQGSLFTYVNNEEGYIKVVFESGGNEDTKGNIVIRRSDSKADFLNWQDLTHFLYSNKIDDNNQIIYYDFTPESGIAYKYLIQYIDPRGRRGTPVDSQIVIPEWQHAFLLENAGNGQIDKVKQLKLKYDFQISSYKTNISESKTDTIGSQYPFIRRNGNMYYRSFPISGTITAYMDNVQLFIPKSVLYDSDKRIEDFATHRGTDLNNHFGTDYNLNKQYDYIYERKFREEVEKFLYNAKPKLYKSTQEGNIFIKIMEVSLTPKAELDRLIYSFSGTAYEIDEASLKTLNNYGFIDIGVFDPQPEWPEAKLGQITSFKSEDQPTGNVFKAGQDIIGAGLNPSANSIAKKHKYKKIYNNEIVDDFYIDHLKLTIESEPYLIIEDPNTHKFRVFDDIDTYSANDYWPNKEQEKNKRREEQYSRQAKDPIDFTSPIEYPLYQIESTYNSNNVYLGTLFEINGEQIIVSYPNNIYELKDDNLKLASNTTIIPAKDTIMTVDYKIYESHKEDLTNIPKRIISQKKLAQIYGKYNKFSRIITQIKNKHTFSFTKINERTGEEQIVRQYISGLISILIDTEPGTVVEVAIKNATDKNRAVLQRLVVNETGQLLIDPEDTSYNIVDFVIKGFCLEDRFLRNRGSFSIEQGETLEQTLEKISNALHGDFCIINNQHYTFYKSKWYQSFPLTEKKDDGNGNIIEEIIYRDQEDKEKPLFMDIACPVDALIFYTMELRRDFF